MIQPATVRARAFLGSASLLAASFGLAGCLDINTGFDGVPLDELDRGERAPTHIALVGPDDVIITIGETLDIVVEGDDAVREDLRFRLKDDTLQIGRKSDWSDQRGTAVIRVTMPAPQGLDVAGSGDISAPTLAKRADLSIAGSGAISIATIASDALDVSIAGSGALRGSGTVTSLDINIAGSGDVDFADLKAQTADISIAGSGDVALASDGTVDAAIMGSGNVAVKGSATCKVNEMGSGTVTCTPSTSAPAAR